MHALTSRAAAALAGILLASSSLAAQAAQRPSIGVSGGLAIPTGDAGDGLNSGYNISAHVGFQPSSLPVGVRIEGMYNRFDFNDDVGVDGHTNLLALTANAILGPRVTTPGSVRPYAIGGLGIYNAKASLERGGSSDSETNFGLNIGAGLDLPLSGIATFVEARYHHVFSDPGSFGMIPIVVGIRF